MLALTAAEQAVLAEVVGKKALPAAKLANKAYYWSKRLEQVKAMVLYAAADAAGEADSPLWRIRCAEALLKLRQPKRAIPLLESALAADWSPAELSVNDHFRYSGYVSLIQANLAVRDDAGARAAFWAAVKAFAETGREFPWVFPAQDALAAAFKAPRFATERAQVLKASG